MIKLPTNIINIIISHSHKQLLLKWILVNRICSHYARDVLIYKYPVKNYSHSIKLFDKSKIREINHTFNINDNELIKLSSLIHINIYDHNRTDILRYFKKIRSIYFSSDNIHRLKYIIYPKQIQKLIFDYTIFNIKMKNEDIDTFHNLTTLSILNNKTITDDGIKNLVNLRILAIRGNITDNAFKKLNNLVELNCQTISDEGLKYLPKLEKLCSENNNNITDIGLQKLKQLQYLNINYNNTITDNSIIKLKELRYLTMRNNMLITQ